MQYGHQRHEDEGQIVGDDLVHRPHRREQRVLVVGAPAAHEEPDDLHGGDRQEEEDADVQVRDPQSRREGQGGEDEHAGYEEDVVPRAADRSVYNLAPIVFLVPCMLIFATLPFAPGLGIADLNIGILFFLAISAMEIVGLFMGGWGSNNKYALLSVMRAVNQIISYDLPFVFAAMVPVVLTGSLKLSDIAAAQPDVLHWFIFYPVIG